jgi:Flp pilus assembly protein TadG
MNNAIKRRRSRAGNVGIEFAIGSVILVTAFTSAFQYGYIFYQYNALQNAVANGAYYGALRNYVDSCSVASNTFSDPVKNMVVYGDPTVSSGTPTVRGLTTGVVTVTISPTQATCPTTAWAPLTINVKISSLKIDGVFGSFTVINKPSSTYAYQGIYSPP